MLYKQGIIIFVDAGLVHRGFWDTISNSFPNPGLLFRDDDARHQRVPKGAGPRLRIDCLGKAQQPDDPLKFCLPETVLDSFEEDNVLSVTLSANVISGTVSHCVTTFVAFLIPFRDL